MVTSNDISWKEHIDIQAVVQKYVDTAVSKTINMPRGTTPQEVRKAYIYAWKRGLKGLTVYVDGSRDPILTTSSNTLVVESSLNQIQPVSRDNFGDVLTGNTYKKKTACGTLYITINKDENVPVSVGFVLKDDFDKSISMTDTNENAVMKTIAEALNISQENYILLRNLLYLYLASNKTDNSVKNKIDNILFKEINACRNERSKSKFFTWQLSRPRRKNKHI